MSPDAEASPAHNASPLPCIGGRPRVISSWDTTNAPAGAGHGGGAVGGPRIDHDDLIHQGNRRIRALRIAVDDRPDRGLLVPGRHDDAHCGLTLGPQQPVWRPVLRADSSGTLTTPRRQVTCPSAHMHPPARSRLSGDLRRRGFMPAGTEAYPRCRAPIECRARGAGRMDICRIGLIGAGNVGRRHARVLGSFPDVHLAGITDVVPEAAAALARRRRMPAVRGRGELLSAGLDAVVRLRAAVRARRRPRPLCCPRGCRSSWRSRWPRRRKRPSGWASRSPRRAC